MYVIVALPADPLGNGRTTLTPLTWLLIPLATLVMASIWGVVAGRPRRADDVADVERYDRFRAALARAAS
jgi:hypothetical protein